MINHLFYQKMIKINKMLIIHPIKTKSKMKLMFLFILMITVINKPKFYKIKYKIVKFRVNYQKNKHNKNLLKQFQITLFSNNNIVEIMLSRYI